MNVYTLSVLAQRYLPLQSQARGRHVEIFAYMDRDLCICTIIVGEAPSTEKRLCSLSVEVSVNTVTAGKGERPSGSNQPPAWAVCLLFTTTSRYSWTWSTTRECGLSGDDERWVFSKAYVRGECGVGPVPSGETTLREKQKIRGSG